MEVEENAGVKSGAEHSAGVCVACLQEIENRHNQHEQVHISHGQNDTYVDKGIAPLILECWRAGIDTTLSCEDNIPSGWVWIEFMTPCDAERFLSIAAGVYSAEVDGLYNRIVNHWNTMDDIQIDYWKYSTLLADLSVSEKPNLDNDTIQQYQDGETQISICISVRFPSYDLKQVLYNLCQFNAVNQENRCV